jgi:Phage integrase, N-terminal SAM-like domain
VGWSSRKKAARGPVVTKVPTIGQFIHRWLEETVAPNLAPLTYATYETHVKNYIEPESIPLRLDRLRVAAVQAWLNPDILQSFDGRSSDGHGLLLLTVGSVPLLPTDWAGTELPGNLGRTAGQDLQEMLVLITRGARAINELFDGDAKR